ncbi:MAG: DUF3343 domain-containing protein [Thermodesulfobacteriota bacterium]
MSLWKFWKRKEVPVEEGASIEHGLLVFANTSEVIRAENLLRAAGVPLKVMGPPPEIQSGCDLVIQFPLIRQLEILRILEGERLVPLEAVPVTGPLLKPVDLFQVKDFGRYLMVRAANMKLTVDKETRVIVNVSGGGCPDVPYLAYQLVGQTLGSAPRPRHIGHTVCGYALELAFEEMERQCSGW